MQQEIDLSIIIVDYNSKAYTIKCVESLLSHLAGMTYEIIVIDNCSPEKIARTDLPKLHQISLVEADQNLGFGNGNNIGAAQAKGTYILLLNPDTLIFDNSIEQMFINIQKDPQIGILGPQIITSTTGPAEIDHYGDFPTLTSLISRNNQRHNKVKNSIIQTERVTGACMMMRRSLFNQVGGFDTKFFMYFEDTDLCKKIALMGYQNAVLQDAKIIHFGGKSQKNNKKKKQIYYKSQDYFFKKHYGLWPMLIMKIIRWPIKTLKTN